MEDHRDKILDVALDEFAKKGVQGTSLEQIAEVAGVELPVIRHSFVNLDRLFRAVVERETFGLFGTIEMTVSDTDDPREFIRRMIQIMDMALETNPTLVKLFLWVFLDSGQTLKDLFTISIFPSDTLVKMENLVQQGKFRCSSSMNLGIIIEGLIVYKYFTKEIFSEFLKMTGQSSDNDTYINDVLEILEHGIFVDD